MVDCSVKKECNRLISQKAASGNTTSNSQSCGHLRNVKEEGIEEQDVGTNEVIDTFSEVCLFYTISS